MRKVIIMTIAGLFSIILGTSCSSDLGNYDYTAPEVPVVTQLDSTYSVNIGSKLVITPKVAFGSPDKLSYEWKIIVPAEMREVRMQGPSLDMYFTLEAGTYSARLAVEDNSTGMKYFYYFKINAKATFSQGIVLLTSNQGKAEISFINKDSTVLPNIYEHTYGESLPNGPLQIVPLQHMSMTSLPYLGYWILCSDKKNPGVELDVNTFRRIKYFRENFFNEPEEDLEVQFLYPTPVAVMKGVVNGKLYIGASSTYYMSPIYGYFGIPVAGNYTLSSSIIYNDSYVIGHDSQQKSLVYFDGGGTYYGTSYDTDGAAFDPENLNVDVLYMSMVNTGTNYVLARSKDDQKIYEYKFGVKTSPRTLSPLSKKEFAGSSLVAASTKWVLSRTEVFYFTSNDKIYRYNPLNEEVRPLDVDFGGKPVTFLKLSDDGNNLITGTDGHLYFLDISTGKNGNIVNQFTGFTGAPVDAHVRK